MKVFFSYQQSERGLAADLAGILRKEGYDVFFAFDDIQKGTKWEEVIASETTAADVYIIIVGESPKDWQSIEARQIVLMTTYSKKPKMVLPIIIGAETEIPEYLRQYQAIIVRDKKQFNTIKQQVLFALKAYSAMIEKEAAADKEAQELLQKGIKDHINSVLDRLRSIEQRNKIYAGILYALSGAVLLATIAIAFTVIGRVAIKDVSVEKIAIVGGAYLIITVLVISFSKFLFTLAKSFMVEAIRCSDRIHAISFGKFYIEAFDEKVTREEVIKIFNTWNIDNGATVFRSQSGDDFDPKLNELFGLLKKTDK